MSKAAKLLQQAEEQARTAPTWTDLSNALFDPLEGLIARAFPTRAGREAFMKTEEYRKIRAFIDQARERTGLVAGATPKKCGRFVVRLPISLHAALEREAPRRGSV
jgi:hypothetical protein